MSSEAVAGIWIGAAALNGTLIWLSVGLSRVFGHAGEDPEPEPAPTTEPGDAAEDAEPAREYAPAA